MTTAPYFTFRNSDLRGDTIDGDVIVSMEGVAWCLNEASSTKGRSVLQIQYTHGATLTLVVSSTIANGRTVSDRFRDALEAFRNA